MPRRVVLPENRGAFSFTVPMAATPIGDADAGIGPLHMSIRHNNRDGCYYFEADTGLEALLALYNVTDGEIADSPIPIGPVFTYNFGITEAPRYRLTGKLVTNWPLFRLLPLVDIDTIVALFDELLPGTGSSSDTPLRPEFMLLDQRTNLGEPDLGELSETEFIVFAPVEYASLRWLAFLLDSADKTIEDFDSVEDAVQWLIEAID